MPPKPKTTRRTTKKTVEPKPASAEIQKLVQAKPLVSIDFPQAGETVLSGEYSFRITAPDASKVEISIDNSPWQPCREAVGHWWYDWTGFEPGVHQARVQILGPNGAILAVASRQVGVGRQ
jgi:hypothetical protein